MYRAELVGGWKPTICHVLHSLNVGGAEILADRLARDMAKSYRFVFACLDGLGSLGESLRRDGFPVNVFNRRTPGFDVQLPWRLMAWFRRQRVNIIHAHQYSPFCYAAIGRFFLGGRVAILFTEHGRHHPDYRRPKRVLANRLLLRPRDRVVGVGDAVRRALIVNEGLPPNRVATVYNGIRVDAVVSQTATRLAVRAKVGVSDSDVVAIQVARLDYLKDHLTALRALKRVLNRRRDVYLLVVGDGPERARIEEAAKSAGLLENIRFLGLRTDVASLVLAADMFVLSSISEGIPLTIIEAMRASLPVIATNVGGIPEMVEDGRTGILCSAGDDGQIAEGILRLAGDPELRAKMGRSGRAVSETRFSAQRMNREYERLYEEMLTS